MSLPVRPCENQEQYKPLVEAFERERVVVLPPIEFRSDRTMQLTIIGESDEIQSVIDELPAGMNVDVLRIGGYADVFNSGLTDRQQEALSAAWTIGYYSVPREGDWRRWPMNSGAPPPRHQTFSDGLRHNLSWMLSERDSD